jgi:hypothetical protein
MSHASLVFFRSVTRLIMLAVQAPAFHPLMPSFCCLKCAGFSNHGLACIGETRAERYGNVLRVDKWIFFRVSKLNMMASVV